MEDQAQDKQPQIVSTLGQPDLYLAERKNLSATPIINEAQYFANQATINGYRAWKLEQMKKEGTK